MIFYKETLWDKYGDKIIFITFRIILILVTIYLLAQCKVSIINNRNTLSKYSTDVAKIILTDYGGKYSMSKSIYYFDLELEDGSYKQVKAILDKDVQPMTEGVCNIYINKEDPSDVEVVIPKESWVIKMLIGISIIVFLVVDIVIRLRKYLTFKKKNIIVKRGVV